jgi:hypothetical protein
VTVTLKGAGAGTIASTPAGITCTGTTCTGSFPPGTAVTLTPTPNATSFFTAWSGACTGTTPCALQAKDHVELTAEFSNFDKTVWTGSYSGQQKVGRCFANNGGNFTVTFAQKGTTVSSKVDMTGIDMRNTQDCSTAGMADGESGDSPVQLVGATLFGTWIVAATGPTSHFTYPFIATLSGTTIKGTWTCPNCPGDFTLTKKP